MNLLKSSLTAIIITTLVFISTAPAAWHADLLPDYTEDVEQWWYDHPFNSEGPNYDMTITHPAATVNLTSGQSIQNAINSAGSSGVTIYLDPGSYSNFEIVGKSNIHIIANSGATVNCSEKNFAACTQALDYHNFNACVYGRDPGCIDCFRNPLKNIYISGVTFDGGGSTRASHYMKVVRGVVFESCTWQNFGYVGAHHPGMINGHEKLENIWFIDCHFVGTQYNGSYLDGAHATGFVNCEFEAGCYHGILFLTNDDFSEDFNDNGKWESNEKRNAQYNVVVGCIFDGVPNDCIDINQGGNILIKDNVQYGTTGRFIYSTDRCSQRWHDLFYEGLYNRVFDNVVNNCTTFYEVNSREFNCPDYSSICKNYGKLGRYQIRGNDVNCSTFMYAHGNTIYDPRFVEDNRINGSGTAVTDFVNAAPTASITYPTDGNSLPVATEATITANASDSDGTIDTVTFRVDDIIIGNDGTAPYEAIWTHGTVTLGSHKISIEVMDNDGKKTYDEINITVVDDANTDVQSLAGLPIEVTSPIGNTRSSTFTVNLDGAATANLYFLGFDIDDETEAKMYINGTERPIPCYAMTDTGPHDDSMELPISWLNDGTNTVVFEFANNPDGTTRYVVEDFVVGISYSGNRVAKPTLTPASGQYECYTDVTMQTSTAGAEIWYTTDGSEPNQGDPGSTQYTTTPVRVDVDTTIKAKAFKTDMDPSFTATETYLIQQTRDPDTDGDADVDIDDLNELTLIWLTSGADLIADFSCDDEIDLHDYSLLAESWAPPVTGTFQQDSGTQGIISMEAENYNLKIERSGIDWTFVNSPTGYSGNGAVSALPNSGVNNDLNYATNSPEMQFDINFVKTGTHYLWSLGGADSASDDSFHFGIDGVDIADGHRCDINEETGNWGWSNDHMDSSRVTFDVNSTGLKTLNIWMREDGARLDKIVITTDSAYTPTGTGPAESPRN